MTSAIRQLLDEISWEGNARKYRGGGLGKENVVTTEVFQALDLLPRGHFLAPVLADLSRESCTSSQALAVHAETLTVEVLPGDLTTADGDVRVQPDVTMSSDSMFVLVEAKAPNDRSSFQPEQLARELVVTRDHARGRLAVLLLVLGAEPPVPVRGHGRMAVDEAIALGLTGLAARGVNASRGQVDVCWTTWGAVADRTALALAGFRNADPSVVSAVSRLAHQLTNAIRVHTTPRS